GILAPTSPAYKKRELSATPLARPRVPHCETGVQSQKAESMRRILEASNASQPEALPLPVAVRRTRVVSDSKDEVVHKEIQVEPGAVAVLNARRRPLADTVVALTPKRPRSAGSSLIPVMEARR